MRVPRMTTRPWMIAVTLVAITLGILFRWNACWRRAGQYESQRSLLISLAQTLRGDGISSDITLASGQLAVRKGWAARRGVVVTNAAELEAMALGFDQAARERDTMRRQCFRAIYRIWEPVPPPPPPFARDGKTATTPTEFSDAFSSHSEGQARSD
jgi:hypothetical protein